MSELTTYFLNLFKDGCPFAADCEVHEDECDELPRVAELGHNVDCMWLDVFDIIEKERVK